MNFFLGTRNIPTRVARLAVACAAAFLLVQFVSLYLDWPKQIELGTASVALVLIVNRASKSKVVTLSLMLVSMAVTLRYAWWRVGMVTQYLGDQSHSGFTIDSVLMLVLLSAEAYTILVTMLGFMQTSSPLQRKPIALPADEDLWPHVDVLIPTYNEPLALVRYTVLAAVNIDYPPQKLHVYILDDGTRADFRAFAEEAGVGYIVREQHDHAKAGNINHALLQTNSSLITVFDCDHVPTRSFLQVTVGWFLAEQKLAMLQTPYFFYSPDPFERNLLQYKTIPNEGELFSGIIQDGNDLWNATLFCGSCAVIRRTALDAAGGMATETATEDAHTSLRMQKQGWSTAYINLPQAAGLATATLSAHVGQRIRWARGMIQIFRADNPMLARGMKLTQRICYFSAMLHCLCATPRLIFLVAPLVYMLGGRTIIPGYWVAILAYALPHLAISTITNSRVQGSHRHSFWNEIYETVMAPYTLLPTLLALIHPKPGSFNPTGKSSFAEPKFDRRIAAPGTWLLALNVLGVLVAPYRYFVSDPTHRSAVLGNLLWILFNMVILGVAAAVATDRPQRRNSVRIPARIPVQLHLAGGKMVTGMTQDMSVGGASLTCAASAELTKGEMIRLSFPAQTGDAKVMAVVLGISDDKLSLKFEAVSIVEQETLTCALYSRADSWINARTNIEVDRLLVSLGRVIRLSIAGFHQVLLDLTPHRKTTRVVATAVATTAAVVLALLFFTRSTAAQSRQNLLGNAGARSTLPVAGEPIPFKSDLSLLPRPLLDPDVQTTTTIAFVFLTNPTPTTLQAAGIVASWMGILAGTKATHFSVSVGEIPRGNAIVFADKSTLLPASLQTPGGGGSLSIRTNPADPYGSVLVLSGDNDREVLNAARALSLMRVAHPHPGQPTAAIGEAVKIGSLAMPKPPNVDDTPRRMATDPPTGLYHWVAMPNLEVFANAGFPFTRQADLAETTIVVPTTPTPKEIALLLYLMSQWGRQTGYPGLRIEIAGPDAAMDGDRDYLVLGSANDQPAFGALERELPVTFDAEGVHVKEPVGYRKLFAAYSRLLPGTTSESEIASNAAGPAELMIEGIESPFFHGRSIIVMSLGNDDDVGDFADTFFERSQSSDIAHTVSLLRNGKFSSFAMDTPAYHVGNIAPYPLMRVWLADHFWILLVVLFGCSLVLARYAHDYLALLTAQRLQADPAQQPI